jgi:putative transcriptional regulator
MTKEGLMRKKKNDNFDRIMEGMTEAVAFARGESVPGIRVHIPAEIDVKAIRTKLGLSQVAFAERHGFSAARVRDWEQGRRVPDAGVRAFLKVIAAEPEMVERVLERA